MIVGDIIQITICVYSVMLLYPYSLSEGSTFLTGPTTDLEDPSTLRLF